MFNYCINYSCLYVYCFYNCLSVLVVFNRLSLLLLVNCISTFVHYCIVLDGCFFSIYTLFGLKSVLILTIYCVSLHFFHCHYLTIIYIYIIWHLFDLICYVHTRFVYVHIPTLMYAIVIVVLYITTTTFTWTIKFNTKNYLYISP